jgi:ABC-type lipoprotein release transport system permease subunit
VQLYLRYALRGLTKRRWRSFFIIFMMMIGVMLMTGTSIAMNSIPSMAEATAGEANMADYSLNVGFMPRSIVDKICENRTDIMTYEVRIVYSSTAYTVQGWPESTEILLFGVEKNATLNKVSMTGGRLFGDDEEAIVVEQDYGENVLGKNLTVEMPSGNVTVKVVGMCRAVWMPRWAVSSQAYALIPLSVLQRFLNANGTVNQILVKVNEGYDPIESMNNLSKEFEPYGPVLKSIEGTVIPFIETQSYYDYLVRLFSLIGYSLFAVSLALMYSSLSLMVTQEFREIGTLKALGTTRRGILVTYTLRSIFLGLLGSIFGALMGIVVANTLVTGFTSMNLTFEGVAYAPIAVANMVQENKEVLAIYSGLGLGLSVALVFPSSLSASRVAASQAIKSFPGLPSTSRGSKPKSRHGPLFIRYAFRSLARKKGREAIVVLVIVISVAINSTLIAASESQQAVLSETSRALNFDFFICLNKRFNSTLLMEDLKPFENRTVFSEFGYYTQARSLGYSFFIIGVPVDASYFNYSIVNGRWLRDNEDGIVLTEHLAETFGAQVGDNLTLSNERISINVTVVGIRRDLIFNVPMVSIITAQKLDNSSGKVNAVVIKASAGVNLDLLINDVKNNVPGYFWYIKKSGIIDIAADVLTKAFQSTAAVMIIFTWFTSLLLIFSIAGQDINEERTVITTLRALGMSNGSCILMIASKLLILGLFSALLCTFFTPLVLGAFSEYLTKAMVFSAPLYLSLSVLLSSAFFILMIIIPSGLALGLYATRTKIIETLRYE